MSRRRSNPLARWHLSRISAIRPPWGGVAWLGVLALALSGCHHRPVLNALQKVEKRGVLRVITRNNPTTYYQGPAGPEGPEYDLVHRFAAELGVKLRLIVPDSFNEILPMIAVGKADLAAAGLTVTPRRERYVRFTPPYQIVTAQVVYRVGHPRPRDVQGLIGGRLMVVAGSSYIERLKALKMRYPRLKWEATTDFSSEDLLGLVSEQEIDYTIADSNAVALDRRFYPELRVAFNFSKPSGLAWAFPRTRDESLYRVAAAFIERMQKSGVLAQILERYYGHIASLGYVGTKRFMQDIKTRLPTYRKLFEEAGTKTGIDWKLLAAIGYQESHWNPHAVSPTGVRGLMMLTLDTADHIGVDNRVNPEQSILGGARYFKQIEKKIPTRIPQPVRTWMALAAYNLGFGHLEDTRILTQERGGNPDSWVDVKRNLPLLSQKRWYRKTRNGYARGMEAAHYVSNIRTYFDILTRVESKQPPAPALPPVPVESVASGLP
ncbi:membrane-bound lytic murein transglycosylase F precursor [bacterium BMS3Bbin12]|nr:membrane-bound lytic murein transglycosylase F precursor [bacterium BMS3Bbin12]GBE49853.1 membrane-bound lytic murein transglycosylase F precursor [bacterium BMS3Bbin13]